MHVAHKLVNGFCRKKGQDRIQETYQPIKLNGLEEIRGIYSRAEDKVADLNAEKDPSKVCICALVLACSYLFCCLPFPQLLPFRQLILKRRVYKFINRDYHIQDVFLVHYRECPEVERPERHPVDPQVFEAFRAQASEFTKQRAGLHQPGSFPVLHSTPIAHADTSSYQKSSPNMSYDAGDFAVSPGQHVQQQQQQHSQMHTNYAVPALERNMSEFDDMESDVSIFAYVFFVHPHVFNNFLGRCKFFLTIHLFVIDDGRLNRLSCRRKWR